MLVMFFKENDPLYRAERSYVGSAMTTIFVCDDQKAKYNYGMCAKPNEQKRAQFSLWFAYAVDVAGDLAGPNVPSVSHDVEPSAT
ncbi:hypothetical protein J4E81_005823 [Alternaria sp. BMP 2799]|nr:hypothetical protein J4E81_005823 [Alternaria sp. BMP 2799]